MPGVMSSPNFDICFVFGIFEWEFLRGGDMVCRFGHFCGAVFCEEQGFWFEFSIGEGSVAANSGPWRVAPFCVMECSGPETVDNRKVWHNKTNAGTCGE